MIMWVRLAGAVVVTFLLLGVLEYTGVSALLGGRPADEVQQAAHGRARDLFWFMVFAIVMATSILAAARRWSGRLLQAAPARRNHGS